MRLPRNAINLLANRETRSWTTSLVVHGVLIVVLSLWLLPRIELRTKTSVLTATSVVDEVIEMALLSTGDFGDMSANLDHDVTRQLTELQFPDSSIEVAPLDLAAPGGLSERPTNHWNHLMEEIPTPNSVKRLPASLIPREPSGTGEVREAGGTDQAVGVITSAIQQELDQGDTLIVWLLDASISLHDNRVEISKHMEDFFRSIDSFETARRDYQGEHLLMNAVVAFGASSHEMRSIHRFGGRVCSALEDVLPDPSGLENVMTAVQNAVIYYRGKKERKERIIFVVVTDESGDDTLRLEETVGLCRQAAIPVHVIGPSAVFGSERGSHLWVWEKSHREKLPFLLPVKRGPDTAMPERILVPYWFESELPPWSHHGARPAQSVPWYGGAYRERLISGFGPYALTRLALQTGGTFTILDRAGDRGRFRMEALREYMPDYGSAAAYVASVAGKPLRQAVAAAATLTHAKSELFVPPRFVFIGHRSEHYPYRVRRQYIPQVDFHTRLRRVLEDESRRLAAGVRILDRAMRPFLVRRVDWEYEYENEESKRWRAWYDLTRGRLLAMKIRCREYIHLADLLPDSLNPTTNHIVLHPWQELRIRNSQKDVQEAVALLRRCVQSNPDTPWAALAQWELNKPLGVQVEQVVVPPPPPAPLVRFARPTAAAPSFPSL